MGIFKEISQETQGIFGEVAEAEPTGQGGLKGLLLGGIKGIGSTAVGTAGLISKGLETAGVPEGTFFTPTEEKINRTKQKLETHGKAEKIGKFIEQVAEFTVPGTKVANATKTSNVLTKSLVRGLTSGAVATAQNGEVGRDTAIAAGVDAALPVAGKFVVQPAKNLLGRLFKGLGGALSGTPTKLIDNLIDNPRLAQSSIKELEKRGAGKILEGNAKTIINGVSRIKQNARKAFGEGLEKLSEVDIKPNVFRDTIKETLDKYGSVIEKGRRILSGVEFDDPKNTAKASQLIDRLSNAKLDGKSLRKLSDDIANSAFKTAVSDERLAFNVFVKDLSQTLKKAVSNSTNKLDDINKQFSTDMQLAEAVEDMFGKVEFKNLSEVLNVSKKLETLFTQKGIAPKIIDTFLNKIGARGLDTSEAVRQISTRTTGANVRGMSVGEMIQATTGAIVTPKAVRDISIATGLAQPIVKKIMETLSPVARGTLIKSLIGND